MTQGAERLAIDLLGGFRLSWNGVAITGLAYQKIKGIVAYLAVEGGRSHGRAGLAGLFWPDSPPSAARANLRQVLSRLRRALRQAGAPEDLLLEEGNEIRFNPVHGCDVAAFLQPLPDDRTDGSQAGFESSLARLEALVASYGGEFLAGFSLPECETFEEWLQARREALLRQTLVALERLVKAHASQGRNGAALAFSLRHTELDPWNEPAHRRSMTLYAEMGQPGAAIRLFEDLAWRLTRELGLDLQAETRQLYEAIKQGRHASQDAAPALASPAQAERSQMTVLFCELSTSLEDQEEAAERLLAARNFALRILGQSGGYSLPAVGGGLLAYFGYPKAQEGTARHAVEAALAMVGGALPVAARVGIHTGLVLTGADTSQPDPLGQVSAQAIQLRLAVKAGEVVISDAAHRLLGNAYFYQDLGLHRLRGMGGSRLQTYRVVAAKPAPEPLSTLLVGRQKEMDFLASSWNAVTASHGFAAVMVSGEAGIGKSSLIRAFRLSLAQAGVQLRVAACQPEGRSTPFFPIILLIQELCGIAEADGPELRRQKLDSRYRYLFPDAADSLLPWLARLLALPVAAGEEAQPYPEQEKEGMIQAALQLIAMTARAQPLLLVLEDIHWADASTLELLGRLAAQSPAGPCLLILSARTGHTLAWPGTSVPSLILDALDEAAAQGLARILAGDALGAPDLARLVALADGVPLFLEELVRTAREGNSSAELPASLRDVLATRLDQLGGAKPLAQAAAILGRSFDPRLAARLGGLADEAWPAALARLAEAGLVQAAPRALGSHRFRHALIREAALDSLPSRRRRELERRAAHLLLEYSPDAAAEFPELVAAHQLAGGEPRQAAAGWMQAGERALSRAACEEAAQHYRSAIHALGQLPRQAERDELEAAAWMGLGRAVVISRGYAAPEAQQAYENAYRISRRRGCGKSTFHAYWGIAIGTSSRHGHAKALRQAQHLLDLAGKGEDAEMHLVAQSFMGHALFWLGRFADSRRHLEQAVAQQGGHDGRRLIALAGEDLRVVNLAYLAWVVLLQGESARSQVLADQSIALARAGGHSYSIGFSLSFALLTARSRGDTVAAAALGSEILALPDVERLPLWRAVGATFLGWSQAMAGDAAGLTGVEAGRMAMRGVYEAAYSVFLSAAAEVHLHFGRSSAALAAIDEALPIAQRFQDGHYLAELWRLRGAAEAARGENSAALDSLARAQAIARKQGAGLLELRAALALAELHSQTGQPDTARQILRTAHRRLGKQCDGAEAAVVAARIG